MKHRVKIGVIGDFNPEYASHIATNAAINHAGDALGIFVETQWVPTTTLEKQIATLAQFDGLWCSPGSPYRSMEGALQGIRFAREQECPFIGTWGGFQHTLVEYARNIVGIEGADHEESNPKTSSPLISKLSCSLAGTSESIKIQQETLAHRVYGKQETVERYSCSFSLNPVYQEQISRGELKFVGRNDDGAIRLIELEGHRYFIASLFLPQMKSNPDRPHPMIVEYLKAALKSR